MGLNMGVDLRPQMKFLVLHVRFENIVDHNPALMDACILGNGPFPGNERGPGKQISKSQNVYGSPHESSSFLGIIQFSIQDFERPDIPRYALSSMPTGN